MTKNKKEFVEKEEFRRFVKDVVDSDDIYSECYASVRECYQHLSDRLAQSEAEIAQLKAALGQVKPSSPFLVWVVGFFRRRSKSPAGVVSEDVIAAAASPSGGRAVASGTELQKDLVVRRPIETILTDIALLLRNSWRAGPATHWGLIYSIRDLAVEDIDKRVAAAVCEAFRNFSQFLCCFEILMLQRVKGTAEFEKTLLGMEQLFVHGHNYFRDLGLVPDGQGGFTKVDSTANSGRNGTDNGHVHKGSPNVEEGDVGVSYSTLRGNTGGEKE